MEIMWECESELVRDIYDEDELGEYVTHHGHITKKLSTEECERLFRDFPSPKGFYLK